MDVQVELLQRAIGECFNRVEQDLAIECAGHLVFSQECRKRMQTCGMTAALQKVLLKIEADEGEWLLRRKAERMLWLLKGQNEVTARGAGCVVRARARPVAFQVV